MLSLPVTPIIPGQTPPFVPLSSNSPPIPSQPRKSGRPRKQSIRLQGYDLSVSTHDFDLCVLSESDPFPEDEQSWDIEGEPVIFQQALTD
jgi:hypothetical protein